MRSVSPGLLLSLVLACFATAPLAAQEEPLVAGGEGVPVPKKTKHVQPVYPPEALAQGVRGIVILDIVVDAQGRVAATSVLRSVPGLDEAAIAAARQWEYEPSKVEGKPRSVRITVPITFSLALPKLVRQAGVPELRQGVTPAFPASNQSGGSAAIEVTLEADGRIGDAQLLSGEAPFSDALLAALKTWRFAPPPDDDVVSFRVEAEFVPARGGEPRAVQLRATGLTRSEILAGREKEPAPAAAGPAVAAAAPPPATAPTPAEGAAPPLAEPSPKAPTPATEGAAPQAPAPPTGTAPPRPDTVAPKPQEPAPGQPEPRTPAPPQAPRGPAPQPPGPVVPAPTPPVVSDPAAAPGSQAAPPPVEVITAPAPAPPPESGISAIRDVTLEPGVPELSRGRRPVPPPLARLNGASGAVEVSFSVGASGNTALQTASGPDVLRYAAEQTVTSWVFRRTRAERAYLTAVFRYEGDKASAVVRPQAAQPAPAAGAEPPGTASPGAGAASAAGPAGPAATGAGDGPAALQAPPAGAPAGSGATPPAQPKTSSPPPL